MTLTCAKCKRIFDTTDSASVADHHTFHFLFFPADDMRIEENLKRRYAEQGWEWPDTKE